jgi:hypothetical protein
MIRRFLIAGALSVGAAVGLIAATSTPALAQQGGCGITLVCEWDWYALPAGSTMVGQTIHGCDGAFFAWGEQWTPNGLFSSWPCD